MDEALNKTNREATLPDDLLYPDTDGKPMAETDDHCEELMSAKLVIRDHFRQRPNVYVAGNLLLYFEQGNPKACVAPDVFVVFGVPKKRRRTYKLWEEGKAPSCVIEMTSRSTRFEDLGQKKAIYALLGVTEYFLFDPLVEYLHPPLQGHRLQRGEYARINAGPGGVLESKTLGLRLVPRDGHLCLVDRKTGRVLPTPDESFESARQGEREAARAEREAARAEREASARAAAERRIKELEETIRTRYGSTRRATNRSTRSSN